MGTDLSPESLALLREAIHLAEEAERGGNLPIGAVIALDGEVVARGRNAIWQPSLALTRHAEMEALRNIPSQLWPKSREMTLVTTLEPCLMCAGAVLLHHLGRLVFGSMDPLGGVTSCLDTLPWYFKEAFTRIEWRGPCLPSECDPLYQRVLEYERRRGPIPPARPAQA